MKRFHRFLPVIVIGVVLTLVMLTGVVDPHVAMAKASMGSWGSTPGSSPPSVPPPPNLADQGWWQKYSPAAYVWNSDPSLWTWITRLGNTAATSGLQSISNVILTVLSSTMFAVIALYKSLIEPDWIMAPLIEAISGVFQRAVGPIMGALLPVLFIIAMGVLIYRYMQGRFRAVWLGLLQMGISLLIAGIVITNFAGTFWVIDHTLNGFTDYIGALTANAMDEGSGSMFDGIWTSYVMEPWEFGQFGFWSPTVSDFTMTPIAQNFLQRQGRTVTTNNWVPYTLGSANEGQATNDYINAQNTGSAAASGEPTEVVSDYQGGAVPPTTAAEGLAVVSLASITAGFAIGFLMIVGYQSFVRELFFVKTLLMGVFAIPASFVPGAGFESLWRWIKMALGHWMVRTGVVLYATLTMALGVVLGDAVALATKQITLFSVVDGTGSAGGQGEGALIFTLILTSLLYVASIFFGLPKVNRFLRSAEHQLVVSQAHLDGDISVSAEPEPGTSGRANAGHPDLAIAAPPEPPKHHHLVRDAAIVGGSIAAAVATGGASLAVEGAAVVGAVGAEAVGAEMAGAAVGEVAASETAGVVASDSATAIETPAKGSAEGAEKIMNQKVRPKKIARGAQRFVGRATQIKTPTQPDQGDDQSTAQGTSQQLLLESSVVEPPISAASVETESTEMMALTETAQTDNKTPTPTTQEIPQPITKRGKLGIRMKKMITSGSSRIERGLKWAENIAETSPNPFTSQFWDRLAQYETDAAQSAEDLPKRALYALLKKAQNPELSGDELKAMLDSAAPPGALGKELSKGTAIKLQELSNEENNEWYAKQMREVSNGMLADIHYEEKEALAEKRRERKLNRSSGKTSSSQDQPPIQGESSVKKAQQTTTSEKILKAQFKEAVSQLEKSQAKQLEEMRRFVQESQKAQVDALKELNPKAAIDSLTEVVKTLGAQAEVMKEAVQTGTGHDATTTANSLQQLAETVAAQVAAGLQLPSSTHRPAPEKPEEPSEHTP